MIELNNLVPNVSISAEEIPSTQEFVVTDELLETQDSCSDNEINVDPDSFMILMAQMVTNTINQTQATNDPIANSEGNVSIEEATIDLKTQISGTSEPIIAAEDQSPTSEIVSVDEQNPISMSMDVNLDDNIALTWINSESYKSLKSIAPEGTTVNNTVKQTKGDPIVQKSNIKEHIPAELLKSLESTGELSEANQINFSKDEIKNIIPLANLDKLTPAVNQSIMDDLELKPDFKMLDRMPNINLVEANTKYELPSAPIPEKTLEIPAHLDSPEWATKFSDHIVWLGQQGIKSALIKVHPEDLGPIEITIKVVKDAASVTISSHSNHVRDIVETALPRLRDMMAEQGLNLSEANINADSTAHHRSKQHNNPEQRDTVEIKEEVLLTPIKKPSTNGLIDYFA